MDDVISPYEVLLVKPDASPDEIRKAYLEMVKSLHPDANQEKPERVRHKHAETFKEVIEAYNQLCDPEIRAKIDEHFGYGTPNPTPKASSTTAGPSPRTSPAAQPNRPQSTSQSYQAPRPSSAPTPSATQPPNSAASQAKARQRHARRHGVQPPPMPVPNEKKSWTFGRVAIWAVVLYIAFEIVFGIVSIILVVGSEILKPKLVQSTINVQSAANSQPTNQKKEMWIYSDRWTLVPTENTIGLWLQTVNKNDRFLIRRINVDSFGQEIRVDAVPYENTAPQPPKPFDKMYLKASHIESTNNNSIPILYWNQNPGKITLTVYRDKEIEIPRTAEGTNKWNIQTLNNSDTFVVRGEKYGRSIWTSQMGMGQNIKFPDADKYFIRCLNKESTEIIWTESP